MKRVPVRLDLGGGWLDCESLAIPGAFVVNMTVTPMVSLEDWPYRIGSGIGGSAAKCILEGKDAIAHECATAGWQDPAVILETGLCVWRSGPRPVLEEKFNPDFLTGLFALQWTFDRTKTTGEIMSIPRDYKQIAFCAKMCRGAVKYWDHEQPRSMVNLGFAINLSHEVQVREGMPEVPLQGRARKYCGSGWGGYAMHLFDTQEERDRFVKTKAYAVAVEPYMHNPGE